MVALGASNLTRGFHALVCSARERGGPEVEVMAALGHGRSYGIASRVLVRTLPGILDCGLWQELERRPAAPTRALVTDVGNDILYGVPPPRLLEWVEESLLRLQRHTRDVVLTDLPLVSLRRLSRARFLLFRTILFPSSDLTLERLAAEADEISSGLAKLAAGLGVTLLRPRPEWYGFDPIHIRPPLWRAALEEMLWGEVAADPAPCGGLEALRLYALRPQREWLLGLERHRSVGVPLRAGGRVWLY